MPATQTVERVQSCLAALRHRGPDAGDVKHHGAAVLGHRRLSIIDLVGSAQPMADPSGRYLLTYNGEIYNYTQVRESLANRWQFSSRGDTEVLLAGLILEGEQFLDSLEGMWAFALWDTQREQLLLGRDRMGKKPLFYQADGANLSCASELPALRKLQPEPWSEDADSTADYLRYGYCLPGFTIYREVHEVLPGHTLHWSPHGDGPRQSPYWQLQVQQFAGTRTEACEHLQEALIEATRKRLVADVEVGAFLSGGVDSSLICAIVRRELQQPLKTFTIGFDEASYDERAYARSVAQALRTEHYEDVLAQWHSPTLERLQVEHVGQPFADSSLLPTHLVCQVAAREVKVALSGDGGDELFCGYQRYQARQLWRWYSRLPKVLRQTANRAVRTLPEPMAHHSRSLLKKAHLFMDVAQRQDAEWPYFAPMMFNTGQLSSLAPGLQNLGHAPPAIPAQTDHDDLQRMMVADALIYLPQDILVKVDRASMACSLEARAPFLDRRVVELAFSLPRTWHRSRFAGKKMLRQSFGHLISDSVWQRRKQGFGAPVHEWFRGQMGEHMRQLLAEDPGPLNPEAVSALLARHQSRSRDHGYQLWTLFSYLLWRHQCL